MKDLMYFKPLIVSLLKIVFKIINIIRKIFFEYYHKYINKDVMNSRNSRNSF